MNKKYQCVYTIHKIAHLVLKTQNVTYKSVYRLL